MGKETNTDKFIKTFVKLRKIFDEIEMSGVHVFCFGDFFPYLFILLN